MKNKFYLFTLIPMALSIVGCNPSGGSNEPKPVDVILISGQSNGVGCTWCNQLPSSMGQLKYEEFQKGYPEIQIAFNNWTKTWPATGGVGYEQQHDSNNKFVDVKLGQGNGTHSFGPEIGIAEELHEEYGNRLFIIKCACGGSNLKDDWMKDKKVMYPEFMKFVKAQMESLKEKGYIPTIKALCWMQGEGDSYYGLYQVYQANTRQFVADVRADLREYSGENELAFIDAGINNNSARWQYWKQVNDAKIAFSQESENNFYIDTIGAGMHTNKEPVGNVDADHYDSDSEVLLGHLFAQAFKPFLAK